MRFGLLTYLFIQFFPLVIEAQTCCSAGVPINAFLEMASVGEQSLAINLNYEYRSIDLLVDNNSRLQNDPRSRYGQNISAKVDYRLNSKFAFSLLLPLVHHSRNTSSESQNSFGIGDLGFFVQYKIFASQTAELNLTAGVDLPLGVTGHRGHSQVFLSPDMQSGSGSYDLIVGTSLLKSDFVIPFLTANFLFNYRFNGTNDNFGSTDSFAGRSFAFGDEWLVASGLRYTYTTKAGFFIPDVALKWRQGKPNKEQGFEAPNSGGQWLSLPLGLSFTPDDKKSIRIYTEIPLYQDLNGLQITTDLTLGFQIAYSFQKDNK